MKPPSAAVGTVSESADVTVRSLTARPSAPSSVVIVAR
jgi:hypothetical protein